MKKVLIGISTHNRASILPKAIQSAFDQDYPSKEVAVFDDASTDATQSLREKYPDVRWLRAEENKGLLYARNYLMHHTDADYYFSLDDDAWFTKGDEISIGTRILEQRPEVAALAYDILSPDRPTPVLRGKPYATAMFIGCGHILRLSAVRKVGGYEPMPGSYGGEEKDLCLRLLDAGYQIVKLPGVHVWHDKTPLARDLPEQHRSGVCNDLVLTLRRTPTLLLSVALAAKLYRHLTFSLNHGLTEACLEGFKLFFRSVPQVWMSRHPVKAATLRAFMRLTAQNSVVSGQELQVGLR